MSEVKVALISGAATGIGRAAALRLARRGYSIVIADIQLDKGTATAIEITKLVPGAKAAATLLDVASEESWIEAVAFTVKTFGGLSTLVNNAGIAGPPCGLEDQSLVEWNKLHAINAAGPFLGCKSASVALHKAGKGAAVVNISSLYAISGGLGGVPAYHASKGAVSALTKTVALAWAPAGIRVNAVQPGYVVTDFTMGPLGNAGLDALLPLVPLGRHAVPEDIAKAIEFLATDDSSFMTGVDLLIDGGLMLK